MKRKFIVTFFIILLITVIGRCTTTVEGYKKFSIAGLESFFELNSLEEQEDLLSSDKLKFCERNSILFIPFIKEISETECAILIVPYSKNVNDTIVLEDLSMQTEEGVIICQSEERRVLSVYSKWDDSMILIGKFTKSDDWFINGKKLKLNLTFTIEQEDKCEKAEILYDIIINEFRGPIFQV